MGHSVDTSGILGWALGVWFFLFDKGGLLTENTYIVHVCKERRLILTAIARRTPLDYTQ